ncbi:hypothetical protein SeLEV6574_g04867 [Synchytrium endobioticum]|uniref:Uncharacterized protein n=1 Tax=Synchytrium endobioticum TaxID=286115 RepID=A0A507CXL2_9FUNG|nr:hypothetical protein SeLEV6574_g04867 [Synchytrium endobioticum]
MRKRIRGAPPSDHPYQDDRCVLGYLNYRFSVSRPGDICPIYCMIRAYQQLQDLPKHRSEEMLTKHEPPETRG